MRKAVELRKTILLEKSQVSAVQVITEISKIAMFDLAEILDEGDRIKPIQDWTPTARRSVSYEVEEQRDQQSGQVTALKRKVAPKLRERIKAPLLQPR